MAQIHSDIIAADSKVKWSDAEITETGEKDVQQVDPPLVIINKIIENPEKVKAHGHHAGSYNLSNIKRAAGYLGFPTSAAKGAYWQYRI